MKRQNDIELYLRDCPPERIMAWLESTVGPLRVVAEWGSSQKTYESRVGVVVITPGIENGPFTSVWLNSPRTPWDTDVDCAREAALALNCVVRCCPGQHFPEVLEDTFLEIDRKAERLVVWDSDDD